MLRGRWWGSTKLRAQSWCVWDLSAWYKAYSACNDLFSFGSVWFQSIITPIDQRHTFKTLIYIEHLSFIKWKQLNWLKLISLLFSKEKFSVLWISSVWIQSSRWLIIHQYHREEIYANVIRVQIGIPVEVIHMSFRKFICWGGDLSLDLEGVGHEERLSFGATDFSFSTFYWNHISLTPRYHWWRKHAIIYWITKKNKTPLNIWQHAIHWKTHLNNFRTLKMYFLESMKYSNEFFRVLCISYPTRLSFNINTGFSSSLGNSFGVRHVASQVALVIKNPLANAGDSRDMGLIPGLGRFPGVGNGNPLKYSCLENSMGP